METEKRTIYEHENIKKIIETMNRLNWDLRKINNEIDSIIEEKKKDVLELRNLSEKLELDRFLCLEESNFYNNAVRKLLGFPCKYEFKYEWKKYSGGFPFKNFLYCKLRDTIPMYYNYREIEIKKETVKCSRNIGNRYDLTPVKTYKKGEAIYNKADCSLLLEDAENVKLIEEKLNIRKEP